MAVPVASAREAPGRCPAVLIVDNHPVYRDGLARALESRSDLRLAGEAEGGREALERLLNLDVPTWFLRGNCEREVLAQKAGEESKLPEPVLRTMRWSGEQLLPEQERLLAAWPLTVRREIPGLGEVLFCHATPRDDNEIFTRLTREFSDPAVAIVLERRFPDELGDRLITAVELSDPQEAAKLGYSAAMVQQTIHEAADRVSKVPVARVFDWKRLYRQGWLILALTLVAYIVVGLGFVAAKSAAGK